MTDKQKQWLAWGIIALVITLVFFFLGVKFPIPEPPLTDEEVILGTTHFTNISVEDATVTDDLAVTDDTSIGGDLTVTGNTSWGCSATSITGSMTISGTTVLSGSLVVSTTAAIEDLVVTDTLTTKSLSVDGGVLNVGGGSPGSAAGDNDLYVTADLEVDGTLYADGAANVAGDLTVTGDILGNTNIISKTAAYTLTAAESGSLATNLTAPSGGFTYTLPSAALGLNYCFYIAGTEVMTIAVHGGDFIHHLTSAAGDIITNTTIGDQLCLKAIDVVYWVPTDEVGTWYDATP